MSIKYVLVPNHLTSGPDDLIARVQTVGTLYIDDLFDDMIRSGSTVTKAEALSSYEELSASVVRGLAKGYRVVTPLFIAVPSIRGVFQGKDDPFTNDRHLLRVSTSPGVRLKEAPRLMHIERMLTSRPQPEPVDYDDVVSDTRNTTVTPGGLGRLTGNRMKFDPADAQQGIFFIDENSAETRVDQVVRNKPGELNFLVPDTLVAGPYRMEVRSDLFAPGDVRAGVLSYQVTVR